MKVIFLLIVLMGIPASYMGKAFYAYTNTQLDNQTKAECHEYATRSHALEVSMPRYVKEKQFIDNYPWYNDCIQNIENPVATK